MREIYYIQSYGNERGSEQRAGRPAIIVSNDKGNQSSSTVEVVYLTTQPKHDLPLTLLSGPQARRASHFANRFIPLRWRESAIIAESAPKNEMQSVDIALLYHCHLITFAPVEKVVERTAPPVVPAAALRDMEKKLLESEARLSLLQTMYTDLLQQITAR